MIGIEATSEKQSMSDLGQWLEHRQVFLFANFNESVGLIYGRPQPCISAS
jgi:hypothetical protein